MAKKIDKNTVKKPGTILKMIKRGRLNAGMFHDDSNKNEEPETLKADGEIPKEITLWLKGVLPSPPEGVKGALKDVNEKLQWVLVWNVVKQLSRVSSNTEVIDKIEKLLVKDEYLDDYSNRELMQLHKQMVSNNMSVLDYARKFLLQNQDMLTRLDNPTDNLLTLLRKMDGESIAILKSIIEKEGV